MRCHLRALPKWLRAHLQLQRQLQRLQVRELLRLRLRLRLWARQRERRRARRRLRLRVHRALVPGPHVVVVSQSTWSESPQTGKTPREGLCRNRNRIPSRTLRTLAKMVRPDAGAGAWRWRCPPSTFGGRRPAHLNHAPRRLTHTNPVSPRSSGRRRARRPVHQHDPHARGRHGREGQLGPSGRAHGLRAHRARALVQDHALQPRRAKVDEPRSLRAVERPQLRAALLDAAPDGLRPAHERAAALPQDRRNHGGAP